MKAVPVPFRTSGGLRRARLRPDPAIPFDPASPFAATWNRIGGLLARLGRETGIPPEASLAVWMVECGGLEFRRGRPVLRFEPHVFFDRWGKAEAALFDAHFQFGGRNGIEGARWQNHRFRPLEREAWRPFHGDQSAEYRALALAISLAGREAACLSASFGGPQIMGFNYAVIGYGSATEMVSAFARSERWQVCGFFDFCAAKGIIDALMKQDWLAFAHAYNGPGNAAAYAGRIAEAHGTAARLLNQHEASHRRRADSGSVHAPGL